MLLPAFRRIIQSPCLIRELLAKYSIPRKKVVIDFSSPNIAKTFHMGHLRSTMCGNFLQRLYRLAGFEVVSVNFLGDWGNQIALLALYWMRVMDGREGRAERPTAEQWAEMDTRERMHRLTAAYAAAHKMKRLNGAFEGRVQKLHVDMERHRMSWQAEMRRRHEAGDEVGQHQKDAVLERIADEDVREAFQLWHDWVDTSRAYLQDFYTRFGVQFDCWEGESDYVIGGATLTDQMIRDGLCKLTRDGLWAVCQPEVGPGRDKITMRRADGGNLYMNRELAAIYARNQRYNADQYLYFVDHAQTGHFNQLRHLLAMRGDKQLADRIAHVPFGRIIGVSTRQGKNDSVDFLVEQGEREAREYVTRSHTRRSEGAELDAICKHLSQTTLVFELFMRHRTSDFHFSFRDSFKPGGSNVLSLHEKYSRLNSLELACSEHMQRIRSLSEDGEDWRLSLENTQVAQRLSRQLQEFDIVLHNALTRMDPNTVAIYLLRLCHQIGSAMAVLRVQDEPLALALPRLMLFAAAKKVLGEGMQLLGIEPIEKM